MFAVFVDEHTEDVLRRSVLDSIVIGENDLRIGQLAVLAPIHSRILLSPSLVVSFAVHPSPSALSMSATLWRTRTERAYEADRGNVQAQELGVAVQDRCSEDE